MKTLKKICLATVMGFFGLGLGICIAPIAAVAIVIYMTKVSVGIGYSDNPDTAYENEVKDIDDYIDSLK
jgi:hypothetical protein